MCPGAILPAVIILAIVGLGGVLDCMWMVRTPRRYRFLAAPIPFELQESRGAEKLEAARDLVLKSVAENGPCGEAEAYLQAIGEAVGIGSKESLLKLRAIRDILRRQVVKSPSAGDGRAAGPKA